VAQIPGFHDGLVSVQDAGAQLAAPLLGLEDGMRVLDACAAPGGKSGHILEMADVDLTAVDADAQRLARVGDNLGRLGLSATLVAAEAQARTGGMASVRPHPGRRAVHGLGHRAPPPGHSLAAPQDRHAPTYNTFRGDTRQSLADAAGRW
jgi:hypothetical protein